MVYCLIPRNGKCMISMAMRESIKRIQLKIFLRVLILAAFSVKRVWAIFLASFLAAALRKALIFLAVAADEVQADEASAEAISSMKLRSLSMKLTPALIKKLKFPAMNFVKIAMVRVPNQQVT